ncbi:hypothetical protein EV424DRAFT_815009 [Suillus variegatus]|nr:hypothetical protein EV424DRAFT_815009 [Suillus variegatus]
MLCTSFASLAVFLGPVALSCTTTLAVLVTAFVLPLDRLVSRVANRLLAFLIAVVVSLSCYLPAIVFRIAAP